MKRLIWALTFSFGAPALVVWSFLILSSRQEPFTQSYPQVLGTAAPIYASAEISLPEFRPSLTTADARVTIIENYLARFDSPLMPYARHLIETSDKYSLDYRLLVAIARQESGLCKVMPENSFNCWGYGIYGDQVLRFKNYPEAINSVAQGLKKNYIDHGLNTPQEIMSKYTPPSVEIGGPWAISVSKFLSELE